MPKATQSDLDTALNSLTIACPSDKLPKVEKDIAARKDHPLEAQIEWATILREKFVRAEIDAEYGEPVTQTNNGNGKNKGGSTNPWSKFAWNKTEQGRLVTALGEIKAKAMAAAVGSSLGATKPNPDYN